MRSTDGRFGFSSSDPDFVIEEREAWNRQTPERQALRPVKSYTTQPDRYGEPHVDPVQDLSATAPILKRFEPRADTATSEDRPKTSRGPQDASDEMPGAFPQPRPMRQARDTRTSKFSEGTMTDRSNGIASSWQEHGARVSESSERASEDSDSDLTPRASRLSRDSGSSYDVSEFRPAGLTPGTIRQRWSRLTSNLRSHEDTPKPVELDNKPKRKGVRKSISNWNFHGIGEKMKFFGASDHDLAQADSPVKKQQDAEKEVLNERKRKAEEAYAQQFGTKKQKSNDGIAAKDRQPSREKSLSRTLKRRSVSAGDTITSAGTAIRRYGSPSSKSARPQDPADVLDETDHDHRKRTSRRDLEKENQQLRAMLREQQAQQKGNMHRSASKSALHLPLDDPDLLLPMPILSTSHQQPPRPASAGSNKRQKQHQADAPPVPALPGRPALRSLGNTNGRISAPAETGTIKRAGGSNSRPVSTIFEDPELESDGKENVGRPHATRSGQVPSASSKIQHARQVGADPAKRNAAWAWPDDVF